MKVEVKRIDHLGIVAGTIRDLGIIDTVNEKVGYDQQEQVTAGEIVAGMILNGLGFISRPLMLAPQFFVNKALEILIRKEINHEHFNRHKIGRVLDIIGDYGCEKLFENIALEVCSKEKVNMKFAHADTTSAQRRLRNKLSLLNSTLPNQINKPTANPTMRWIFQLFEGVNYVTITTEKAVNHIIEGLTDFRIKINEMLGGETHKIYQISYTGG